MVMFDCADIMFNKDMNILDAIHFERLCYKARSGNTGRDIARKAINKIQETCNPGEKTENLNYYI